jgi:hypothetical protein
MSKPTGIRSVGNDNKKYGTASQAIKETRRRIEAEMLADLSAQARARLEAHAARILAQSRTETEIKPAAQTEAKCGEEARPSGAIQTRREAAELAMAVAAEACISAESLALRESGARLAAYREAEQAALGRAAAERTAAELVRSRAEADRNATLLQERSNVLLRKAEQKAQQRLATETMAGKAAAFRLQTERELAVLAEQRAEVELRLAHEVELRLRAETRQLAAANERLAAAQPAE